MTTLLEDLNRELGDLAQDARRTLVHVNSRQGGGAGTIWHPDGLVLTNAHVVRNRSPKVILPDGTTHEAKILAYDSDLDVAALSVEASGLPAIELGESRSVRPGQWVMALGHPWGVSGAATGGVVIGLGQDLPDVPHSHQEWIAVSLHLRPGHSGGPLVDAHGRLLGINAMMIGPEVGMAVPVHVVKEFLRRELGSATRREPAAVG